MYLTIAPNPKADAFNPWLPSLRCGIVITLVGCSLVSCVYNKDEIFNFVPRLFILYQFARINSN